MKHTSALFNSYGQLVCFVDDRAIVIDDATRMRIAKTVGNLADRKFERACYRAGIDEPHSVGGSPLLTLEAARAKRGHAA